jgi:hypothetical protein
MKTAPEHMLHGRWLICLLFLSLSDWSSALDKEPLRLAIGDLAATHGERYPRAAEFLKRLEQVIDENEFRALRREARLDGSDPQPLPLIEEPDVDNYDACYLPDGNIVFNSTATYTGVPCVGGSSHVANLHRFEPATGNILRLTFDQEHNWNPTVLPDGRVMYLRWEYSDLPHSNSRILFQMKCL